MKLKSLFLSIASLSLPTVIIANTHYDIVNNCGISLDLYINGVNQGTLASSGGSTTRDLPETWSGFIYTDFNRGNADGYGTVRAGFYGPSKYYYIVTDPAWQNVGLSIQPISAAPVGGFCLGVSCQYNECPANAHFNAPPTAFPPSQGGVPPQQPLYQCPGAAVSGYRVTFCPNGNLPNYVPRPIFVRTARSQTKCLDVKWGIMQNGQPVQIYDCNGTPAQMWAIRRGGQQLKVAGTNYCLDAGSNPANGIGMKIWTCYDNLPQQKWLYNSQNQLVLQNLGLCLDLENGITTNGNKVQTWRCASGNLNQVWNS
ncbi:hypothetical protein CVT24_010154 [Panaeolus cyanescens]|uniref:Ricin B lectin domain-containing protein n=1 Tax=Panaeolus cyanescens TaxID=181874 RepID=A0A409W9C0_9AGAR|nr:hypothetical protein CVT24_010154 [Panaeolus cyanescens]